ncbi:hypothetical protein OROMI_033724 [Orobanche minor]
MDLYCSSSLDLYTVGSSKRRRGYVIRTSPRESESHNLIPALATSVVLKPKPTDLKDDDDLVKLVIPVKSSSILSNQISEVAHWNQRYLQQNLRFY